MRDTMQQCPSCKKRMPDYAHYCAQCGHHLDDAPVKMIEIAASPLLRQSTVVPATGSRTTLYHKVLDKLPGPLQHSVAALLERARDPEPEMVRTGYAYQKTEARTDWGWLPLVALTNSLGVFSV